MSEQFKKSGKGKLDYLPQYNHDNRKSEAPIIEVKKSPQKKPYKIDKSKVVGLFFRVVYLIIGIVTVIELYKVTNGQFVFSESYSAIHDSLQISGGALLLLPIIFLLERMVVYYVENFME